MSNPGVKNGFWSLLKSFLLLSTTFSYSDVGDSYAVRKRSIPCAYYLVKKDNTSYGERISKNLDINELKASILAKQENNEDFKIDEHLLVAVGTKKQLKESKAPLNDLLKKEFQNLKLKSVWRPENLLQFKKGIWEKTSNGQFKKISSLNKNSLEEDVKKLNSQKEYLFVGAPIFSKTKKELDRLIKKYKLENIKATSQSAKNTKELSSKLMTAPLKTSKNAIDELHYFFPRVSDFQKPRASEYRNIFLKVIVPGVIVYTVLNKTTNQPEHVLIPVTLANAASSAFTAICSSFIKNWWTRAESLKGQLLKGLSLGAFFSIPIATAKVAFDSNWNLQGTELANFFTLAGLSTFAATKHLSIIFNTLWRFPLTSSVYSWEKWKKQNSIDKGLSLKEYKKLSYIWKQVALKEVSQGHFKNETEYFNSQEKIRIKSNQKRIKLTEKERLAYEDHLTFIRTLFERYASYLTTPFFVTSLATDQSFFNISQDENGIHFGDNTNLSEDAKTLMSFNSGHAVMAGVGILSAFGVWKRTFTDWKQKVLLQGPAKAEFKIANALGKVLSKNKSKKD